MEIDPSQLEALRQKSDTLRALSTGSIPSSISKLSSSSRALPSEKDFHYYYNFDEFRAPIDEIAAKSHSMLQKIGSSRHLFSGKEMSFPQGDVDDDDACDWLANVNDDVIERFDYSIDEFSRLRKEEEGAKVTVGGLVDQNGFQLVLGKKKRLVIPPGAVVGMREKEDSTTPVVVKVAERDKKTVGPKPKIPFHIPTIKRPQEEFNILVNNANQPFQHVWLERSEDGSRFIHPLEKLSAVDFADQTSLEPVEPLPYESTPFKVVEEVKDLKDLAAKLRSVNEFAVDLEHNQYRSFQGLTCLMQISTRTEDFVVDTLKLRIHIGPYLREVFKDHTKKKVMHGADRDIAWLQRDFGIYVCNLFDTGQASRVLQMERHSLEYLLQHFCGVTANKEYQNADWRLRPLPEEMIRYAREDTHYLLYIYDLMRIRLSETLNSEYPDGLLLEVYKRSYDLCMQLYEKELLTDTSYLYIYGVQGANLNARQLSIVAGLSEWRDMIARAEDESTGYILPNKTLLEIAKQMPLTTSKLRRLVKSKHTYVERNLSAVVTIIRHAVQNASSFEAVAEQLKDGRIQAPESSSAGIDFPEVYTAGEQSGEGFDGDQNEHVSDPLPSNEETCKFTKYRDGVSFGEFSRNANMGRNTKESLASSSQKGDINVEATVQVLRKPNRAFGALLGNSSSRKKPDFIKEKGDNKLEQIKSSVNLPFFSFLQRNQQSNLPSKQTPQESNRVLDTQLSAECSAEPATSLDSEDIILLDGDRQSNQAPEEPVPENQPSSSSKLDDIILLDSDSDDEAPQADESAGTENQANTKDNQETSTPELVVLDEDDDVEEDENDNGVPMSLSDLSSNFQKCLQSSNENEAAKQDCNSKQTGLLQFKPFDYEAAREELRFGENAGRGARTGDNSGGGKNMGKKKGDKSKQEEAGLPQGRRRQAFPASGNRSATFR